MYFSLIEPDTAQAKEEACTVNRQVELTVASMKYETVTNMQIEI
jgi:hypothetical protein